MQVAISIFSIFAVSMIQQNTPDELLGKIMAYTAAVTMCAQPIGQMVYGFLFDRFHGAVYLVLIPSGVFCWIMDTAKIEKILIATCMPQKAATITTYLINALEGNRNTAPAGRIQMPIAANT